jgi:hypothetical protein
MVKAPVERYSDPWAGLCSGNTINIGGGAKGGTQTVPCQKLPSMF